MGGIGDPVPGQARSGGPMDATGFAARGRGTSCALCLGGAARGRGLRVFDAAAGTPRRNKAPVVGRAPASPVPMRPAASS